jgi:hypothetical protein
VTWSKWRNRSWEGWGSCVDMLTNKELLKAYRIAVMEKLDADFIEMLFHEIVRRKLDKPLNSELDKEIDKSGT